MPDGLLRPAARLSGWPASPPGERCLPQVDKDWNAKVADLNLSRVLDEASNSSVAAMNPRWLAPELMRGGRATKASGASLGGGRRLAPQLQAVQQA